MNYSIEKLAERLIVARKLKALSAPELAAKLGIHAQTLYKYEQGKRTPDAELLRRIADITGVSPSWLLMGEQEKEERKPLIIDKDDSKLSRMLQLVEKIYADGTDRQRRELRGLLEELGEDIGRREIER